MEILRIEYKMSTSKLSRPFSPCPKCEVCYDIPAEFSERVTPLINEILTTKLALDPIAMKGGTSPREASTGSFVFVDTAISKPAAPRPQKLEIGGGIHGGYKPDVELKAPLSIGVTSKIPTFPKGIGQGFGQRGLVKGGPSYEKKFETYLNDIVLPALEIIQSALLCPEPNNSGEIENINSNYYGGSSMKKRKKTLKVMRGGMTCKSCKRCAYKDTTQIIKDALNKCIKIINTIILTNGNQISYIGDTDSNKNIRDKIKIDMTNAMKVIQEKSPCPVANNSGESENSNWGGGKRSTRKLAMKKRRKSLRRRRF
jgi:hypothetical protein